MNTFRFGTDTSQGEADPVSTDATELASHMSHCASSHSRFFFVHSAMQSAHGVLSPRIVTVAALAGLASLALILAIAA
ncbi:MAG: hypothetical protein ACT6Q9_10880 [Polaromonas sp.]|jgi:hypothetical protein|uniref:hypothetical protein n=1 Tax=Polaromonas sp. TaxID=1869339 RepID=UPI004036C1FD